MTKNIKVTVVTVVLNSVHLIEATVLSVLAQDHDHLEFVVVDGGSTDGTLAILDQYKERIDRLVVESDRGIYDAMNKSAKLTSGDYIIFMNSGDTFASSRSVSDLCGSVIQDEGFVYGGWVVKYPWGLERVGHPVAPQYFWRGMFVQHQSVMVKTQLLLDHPFDLSVSLGADYAFFLHLVQAGVTYRECPTIVSRVAAGGVSDNNRISVLRSHWQQARLYYPGLRTDLHYLRVIYREKIAGTARRLLPASLVRSMIRLKA